LIDENKMSGGESLLAVGKILRPHGIRGALVVEPLTDWPDRFSAGNKLLLEKAEGNYVEVTVESGGPHKGRYLVALDGVEDREGAEALKGLFLMIRAEDASPLAEDEFWAHELVGMEVVQEGGEKLGEVAEVLLRNAQDLLVVEALDGSEFSIPFVKEFIAEVDVENRSIKVTLMEGMAP